MAEIDVLNAIAALASRVDDIVVALPPAGTNFATNPSFETESATPGIAAGYTVGPSDNCVGTPTYTLPAGIRGSGSKSQRIQYTGVAGDSGKYIYFDIFSANNTYANGDPCTISGYIKGGYTGCVVRLGIIFMNNAGTAKSQGFSATLGISGSVTRFVYTLVATHAETQRAKLEFHISAVDEGDTIDIYLDDFQLEKSLVATPYFDGSYPLSRWADMPNASTSIRESPMAALDALTSSVADLPTDGVLVPPGRTIMFLGDSLTTGAYSSGESKCFRHLLTDQYSAVVSNITGIGGGKSGDFLARESDIIAAAADAVVIELGTNDSSSGTVTPTELAANLAAIIGWCREGNPRCGVVMLSLWHVAAEITAWDPAVEATAVANGAAFVSLRSIYDAEANHGPAGVGGPWSPPTSDWFHPNDSGHAAIAAAVDPALRRVLSAAVFAASAVSATSADAKLGTPAASIAADISAVQDTADAVELKTNTLGSLAVTVTSPVAASGTITIEQGDSYSAGRSRPIDVNVDDPTHAKGLDAVNTTLYLLATQFTWEAASVTETAGGYRVRFEPTIVETAAVLRGQSYKLKACIDNQEPTDDDAETIQRGRVVLNRDIPAIT